MSVPGAPDAAELMRRCDVLAAQSAMSGGIERVYLSPQHATVNAIVSEWMTEAGMSVRQDEAGSLVGRYEGAAPGAPALLLGSHLDTVPDAGRYDGVLGVMLAIAVVARLSARGERLPIALEVLAFGDEEGTRFGTTLLGSRAAAGSWQPEWAQLRDRDGVSLAQAAQAFGLDPARIGEAAHDRERVVGYLEAHIEQGPILEEAGLPLAVVRSIAGARRFQISVLGEAGHAGGTPFERRRDALAGASAIVLAAEEIAKRSGTIATVGRMSVQPGAVNVIPGRADFSLDLRAETDAARDAAWEQIEAAIEAICGQRRLSARIEQVHAAPAVTASPLLRDAVAEGIRSAIGVEGPVLYSKAGHDAMAMDALTGWAMLFIRCAGGVSHHPDESVTAEDVAAALDAFEAAVLAAARQSGARPAEPAHAEAAGPAVQEATP